MNVVLDATTIRPEQGGIRAYVLGLIAALAEGSEKLALTVITATGSSLPSPTSVNVVEISDDLRSPLARAIWRERHLYQIAVDLAADVVIVPVHELPLRRPPMPTVMVVHDVGPLVAPMLYGWPRWLRYAVSLPLTCRRASAIVCVSQATAAALTGAVPVALERVCVIGVGPQPSLDRDDRVRPMSIVPRFLYAGSLLKHKNVDTLVRAFASNAPGHLTIVGPIYDEAEADHLRAVILAAGASANVTHEGFVSVERLAHLYGEATAVVLPSLYEGFGMPALEALAAGRPIVSSDLPSVREVAGDAVEYVVRSRDPLAWRAALTELAADPSRQEQLVARGARRVSSASWENVGAQWVSLLEKLVG